MNADSRLSSELQHAFAERRERMLINADARSVVWLAGGVLAFNLWDRWLDNAVADSTLLIRAASAGLMLLCFFLLRTVQPRPTRVRMLYGLAFLGGLWGTALALSWMRDGYLWGAPGVLIFPLGLAFFPLSMRWYLLYNMIALAGLVLIASWRALPPPHTINLCLAYGFTLWMGVFALSVLRRQQLRFFVLQQKSEVEARTDALTGLWNRRFVAELGLRQAGASRRSPRPLSVLMLDLDHFKRVNDEFGHAAGDSVLCGSARVLSQTLRSVDFLGRWGGEEFLAILLDTDANQAMQVAERCLQAIAKTPISLGETSVAVGYSIGVAELANEETFENLIKRADQALYAAKAAGRGCARLAAGPELPLAEQQPRMQPQPR